MADAPPAPEVTPFLRPTSEGRRLFVGARISTPTANSLASACETLARRARDAKQDWRFISPASFHVTLKYLGWTRAETILPLVDALTAAVRGTDRITFRASRLGGFPALDKATLVYAGLDDQGAAAISALAARVETACTALGFPAADQPFHPHITLARLRDLASAKEVVLPISEQMFGESRVYDVVLFESEAKSSGSVYRELAQIPFKTAVSTSQPAPERQTAPVELGASDDTDDGWPRGHV